MHSPGFINADLLQRSPYLVKMRQAELVPSNPSTVTDEIDQFWSFYFSLVYINIYTSKHLNIRTGVHTLNKPLLRCG